jgi:hypothetical protein
MDTKISIVPRHFMMNADFLRIRVRMYPQHRSADSQNQTRGLTATPDDSAVLAMKVSLGNLLARDEPALAGLLMKAEMPTAKGPMAAEATGN